MDTSYFQKSGLLLTAFNVVGIFSALIFSLPSIAGDTIYLSFIPDTVALEEVTITTKRKQEKISEWNIASPIEVVTMGSTTDNIFQSLATMPGASMQGETGRLVVRGGSSDEVQTFIDDMHVMNPYTYSNNNTVSRGRYSAFMFSGFNFSTGGQAPEYGQSLSGVLPLYTKDESAISKYGINISTVGLGSGGNKAFRNGSASFNVDYQFQNLFISDY